MKLYQLICYHMVISCQSNITATSSRSQDTGIKSRTVQQHKTVLLNRIIKGIENVYFIMSTCSCAGHEMWTLSAPNGNVSRMPGTILMLVCPSTVLFWTGLSAQTLDLTKGTNCTNTNTPGRVHRVSWQNSTTVLVVAWSIIWLIWIYSVGHIGARSCGYSCW